ncbi:tripartite tricarboxylate transporter substrate binding protein [Cupriavidus oxalaticus]|uniref:ABC transporter substrate-binding protein n=1 Tax=Cupriavidus oxalaticus TaxID=96344 RepID=A0A375G8I9_9BURK|nr:tripartite tricarboxylate transporter substrate binding protein [Cupriavidus oxalaticus]QRQ84043.1 tripartite tricarboxylate transporter substrate binding protein [Cupriavidus oxalaticus]QRQ91868.1 tripartite tricarboxylate transporter substrate binding protein [Cupriavidus oxalaticus]WQD86459.1 tripartite tricarboxylate transporter substrate binding protein [Cupriavidus oxalaticus]SPC17671.1 ABC transporter substrate-binding protein [Cupriavidus oxalaticus]
MQANRRSAHLRHALRRLGAGLLAAAGVGLLTSGTAWAEAAFPNKTVRLVVPYPAGGATDVLGRAVADGLGKAWKRPVVVENRPGASSMIGSEAVARAEADGHTALLTITTLVQAPSLYAKPPFDPVKDFVPVSELGTTNLVFAVHSAVPANNIKEFIELVRTKPKQFSYGSYGTGSSGHLYGEIFKESAKLDMVHVSYKGEAPELNDLLGGQVPAAIISVMGAKPHNASGRLRALAVTGAARSPQLPDVPTFREAGVAGMDGQGWFGLFLPAATPRAVVDKYAAEVNRILAQPELRKRMGEMGIVLTGSTPDAFAQTVQTDYARWGKVIRVNNIRLD